MHRKYIPVYIQQDATLHSLFISGNCSTRFGWCFHPSSGAHTTVSTASGICHTVTAIWRYRGRVAATEPVWHTPDAVCTVLDSWWWKERPSETCSVLFQNKMNLRCCASGWFYYRNILYSSLYSMHGEFFRIETLIINLIFSFSRSSFIIFYTMLLIHCNWGFILSMIKTVIQETTNTTNHEEY